MNPTHKKSSEAKHTPLPWRDNGPYVTAKGDWHAPVCILVSSEDPRPTAGAAAKTRAEADANGAFIVRACNSHAELLALAQRIAQLANEVEAKDVHAAFYSIADEACALLDKAEGIARAEGKATQ